MQKELEAIIDKFNNSQTSLEAYQAISDFVTIIEKVPEFIAQAEEEGEKIRQAQIELNADKGWTYGLRGRELDDHNKRRAKKHDALFQLDPMFPLINLNHVHIGIQPENIIKNSDWLFYRFGPDDPLPETDKKEYLGFMNKTYKRIIPFLKTEPDKESFEEIKVKSYDEEKRILNIGNYSIMIAKNEGNNNAHEIMAHVFIDNKSNLTDKFYYADIADERLKTDYTTKDKSAHQPYSGACKRINSKIKDETNGQIKEFLLFNHSNLGYVQINPKYL